MLTTAYFHYPPRWKKSTIIFRAKIPFRPLFHLKITTKGTGEDLIK
jgi:hypothetical protein